MKVGTAAKVFLGKNELTAEFSGIQIGTDVILGKAEGRTKDLSGLVLSNYLMLGKGISREVIATVYGVPPLSLPDAIDSSLYSLKAFGGTEFVPETYIDTVTADGKCEQRDIPDNYLQRQFIYMMDSSYLLTDIVPTPDCKVEFDFQTLTIVASARTYLGCRDTSGSNDGLRVAHISGGNFRIYGFGTYADSASAAQSNTRYKFVWDNKRATITTGGTTIFDNTFAAEGTNQTAVAINGWNTAGTVDANSEGMYLYSLKIWNGNGELIADYVPAVQKGTVPVVGFYDTVSETFKTATAGTFAAGGEAVPTPDYPMDIVSNNGVLKVLESATGITTQAGTPTPANPIPLISYHKGSLILRSVGEYADSYDATTKTITRQVGVKVLDGTEVYQLYGSGAELRVSTEIADKHAAQTGVSSLMCSHFAAVADVTAGGVIGGQINCDSNPSYPTTIRIGINGLVTTVEQFKQWVADKYAAGTPVTVYYPLATETTETVGSIIYTDGTVETITDALSNTATCERLLSVGDYKDTQEVLSGSVTRNISIKALDGTEDGWIKINNSFGNIDLFADKKIEKNTVFCSHFQYDTGSTSTIPDGCVGTANSTTTIYFRNDTLSTVEDWQQWLKDQYAAGTPVIIIYPLATATTETVTGQLLDQEPVTAVGSLSNLVATAVSSSHSTPTPIHPLDIVCNNGVLKYGNVSKNLFDEDYPNVSNSMKYLPIYLGPGTYTCSYSFPHNDSGTSLIYFLNGNVSSGAGNGINQVDASNPRTVSSSTGYVTIAYRNGSGIGRPGEVPTDYNCMLEKGQTATPYEPYRLAVYADGTVETINMHGKNLFDENWNRNTGVSTQTATWGQVVTALGWSTSGLVPVKADQQYTVSYNTTVQIYVFYYESDGTMQQRYDYATSNTKKTFTVPAGATHIRLQVNKSTEAAIADLEAQLETGDTATTHVPYFNGGTATCEDLLSVGTYTDEQEVISGGVTRKVGVKMLDGTESWSVASTNVLQADVFPVSSIQPAVGGYCTALSYTDSSTLSGMPENSFRLGSQVYQRRLYVKSSVYATDATTWTNYLTAQYNAGTPIIVVYPLATETTETVTGQPMSTTEGNNIADITQASMDGLELEVKYYKKP